MVTSIHKQVTGFTQSSMVLAQGTRIDLERLEAAFESAHHQSVGCDLRQYRPDP